MIQHVSAITNQIQTDYHSLFESPIPDQSTSPSNIERTERIFYALGRLSCAAIMTGSVLRGLFAFSPLNLALNIGTFILAHDLFQALKNRQELEQNQFYSLNVVTSLGKGIFSGGKTFVKSVWEGKSDDEVAMNIFRATFNEVAALQSKDTFLSPLWNEIQFQLAIRGNNPFPEVLNK